MRMFVAVLPPPQVLEDLSAFMQPRQQEGRQSPLRWSLPFQWHLTLAFLPQVPERRLEELIERLDRACAKRFSPTLTIAGAGAFPHVAAAKVVWAGVQPAAAAHAEELRRLSVGCRTAAGRAGLTVSGTRFRPHLTLARLGRPMDVSRWVKVLDGYRGLPWAVEQASLIESRLGQGPHGRPRYETVARFSLRSPVPISESCPAP